MREKLQRHRCVSSKPTAALQTSSRALWREVAGAEDGAATFFVLVTMGFMFILGLIAVNVTVLMAARVSSQRAGDAATLAGCWDLPNATKADAAAKLYGGSAGGLNATAASNLESGKGDQVAVPKIDSSGALSELTGLPLQNNRIRVDVSRTQDAFLPAWGYLDRTVKAYAVCIREEGALPVMTALQPSGKSTFQVNNSTLNLGENGALVCSSDSQGLWVTGGGSVTGEFVDVGADPPGAFASSGTVSPPPTYREDCPDPWKNVAEPCPSLFAASCTLSTNVDQVQSAPTGTVCQVGYQPTVKQPQQCRVTTNSVIYPGLYWGGLSIGAGVTVTVQPGVYVMAGKGQGAQEGLEIHPGATLVEGSGPGVSFFIGGYHIGNAKQDCGGARIHSGAKVLLRAPGAEPGKDLLLWQGKSAGSDYSCSANDADLLIEADVAMGLASAKPSAGIIHWPEARCEFGAIAGGSGSSATFNIISMCNQIEVQGPVTFSAIYYPSGSVHHGDYKLVE